jgi:hypothetical protein
VSERKNRTRTHENIALSVMSDERTNLRDKGGWEDGWGTNKQHRDSEHPIGLQKL